MRAIFLDGISSHFPLPLIYSLKYHLEHIKNPRKSSESFLKKRGHGFHFFCLTMNETAAEMVRKSRHAWHMFPGGLAQDPLAKNWPTHHQHHASKSESRDPQSWAGIIQQPGRSAPTLRVSGRGFRVALGGLWGGPGAIL